MADIAEAPYSRLRQNRFHARLKSRTQPFHDQLESRLPLLEPGLTVEHYRAVLRQFYGFYTSLEAAMASAAVGPPKTEVERRRKAQWLTQDLIALGDTELTLACLPRCTVLPVMNTETDIMGALYVVEGATLGGQMVVRALQNSLGSDAWSCSHFFHSYGNEVRLMWDSFLDALAQAADGEECEREIMESACSTFHCFEQWLGRSPS